MQNEKLAVREDIPQGIFKDNWGCAFESSEALYFPQYFKATTFVNRIKINYNNHLLGCPALAYP